MTSSRVLILGLALAVMASPSAARSTGRHTRTHFANDNNTIRDDIAGAGNSTSALSFLIVGDWGGTSNTPFSTPRETSVASAMGTVATNIGSEFVIGAGDNFYEAGIRTNESDPRFQETFEDVYTAASLQENWYFIAGNHDHKGNVTAQIAYSAHSTRWNFPSYWYDVTFNTTDNQTVQILFIDTVLLTGMKMDHGGVNEPVEPELAPLAATQLDWIKSTLDASTADWVMAVGHYPVWSVAEHGPTPYMVITCAPLFDKYGVAAYFSGHEHDLQHLSGKVTEYYVSGAGDKCEYSDKHKWEVPPGVSKFHFPHSSTNITETTGGFASAQITGDQMTVTFYDENATVLYTKTQTNPRKK